MKNLKIFINYLCGEFNNDMQLENEKKLQNIIHPKAKHISNVCNNKVINLPPDFKGYFVIEESYYEQDNLNNVLNHLFLFTENEYGNVILTSYDIPKDISKEDFTNNNTNLIIDYNKLEVSKKFTPIVYSFIDDAFVGTSISYFSPVVTFLLNQRIEKNKLYVSEIFKKDNKIIFGFEQPIIYDKIKQFDVY